MIFKFYIPKHYEPLLVKSILGDTPGDLSQAILALSEPSQFLGLKQVPHSPIEVFCRTRREAIRLERILLTRLVNDFINGTLTEGLSKK